MSGGQQTSRSHEFTHEDHDTNIHVAYDAFHSEKHSLALLEVDTASLIAAITCSEHGTRVTIECVDMEVMLCPHNIHTHAGCYLNSNPPNPPNGLVLSSIVW